MSGMQHRLCIAVDVVRYRDRTLTEQQYAQALLTDLLDAIWSPYTTSRQAQGDGELTVVSATTDHDEVLARVIGGLTDGLAAANRAARPTVRLRVAAHAGYVERGANGFVGHAVIRTCRLVSSPALRRVLVDHPGADLAVLVSETLLEDAVSRERHGLRVAEFRAVDVVDPTKDFTSRAYLHLPAHVPGPPGSVTAELPGMHVHVAAGGQVHSIVQIGELHGGLGVVGDTAARRMRRVDPPDRT